MLIRLREGLGEGDSGDVRLCSTQDRAISIMRLGRARR